MSEAITSDGLEVRERKSGAFSQWFVLTSGVILVITGIAKILSGLGNSKFLAVVDPIIGIKFGQLMLLVGVAEIVIALVCFFSKRQTLALGLVAWIQCGARRLTRRGAPFICIYCAGIGLSLGEQYVELAAQIEYTNYAGKPFGSFPVHCVIGNDRWRIEHWFARDWKETLYCDGTNTYKTVSYIGPADPPKATNRILAFGEGTWEQTKTNVTVWISPGVHPLGDFSVNIPWLAFCSGPYLEFSGRTIPLPTAIIRHEPGAFAYRDVTTVFTDELKLPKSIDLYTSKDRYETSVNDERISRYKGVLAERLNPVFKLPDNALQFHYEVKSSTNFLGWTIPLKFSFLTYRFDKVGNATPSFGGSGSVKYVRECDIPSNVWGSNRVQIVDYRFRHPTRAVDGIIYARTNVEVTPATNDPSLEAKFYGLVQKARDDASAGSNVSNRRTLLIALIAISTLILIWFIGKHCKQKENK